METLLFWLLPTAAVLIGLKGRLMTGWRLFFCSAAALYVGVWIAPSWYGLLDFLPAQMENYRVGIAIAFDFAVIFTILFCASRSLSGGDDDFGFPTVPERILNALSRAGFGIAVSTLLFTLCAATPLRTVTRRDGGGFQAIAHAALFRFTVVGDALTWFRPAVPRAERLNKLWFAPPVPENADPADAPQKDPGRKTQDPKKTAVPRKPEK